MRILYLLVFAVCVRAELVDHHQHLFSPAAAARAGIPPIDAADLIRSMDEAGVDRAAVLSVAYGFSNPNKPAVQDEYAQVKAENDWTSAQVRQHPKRLVGFCSVSPIRDYAVAEIARCARDPYLRTGLKLHFGNSDVDLLDADHVRRVREVFQTANKHRMAVIVHMRSTISRNRAYGAANARVFLETLLPVAPDISVVVAHLGGGGGYEDPKIDEAVAVFADAITKRDPRARRLLFDVCSVAFGNWRDRGDLIVKRMREIGVERMVYGSDAPIEGNSIREALRRFRELPLRAEEFRTIESAVAPYLK